MSGLSSAIGAHTSIGEAPLSSTCRKPRGMIPMIVMGSSSSRTVFPIIAGIAAEPLLPEVVRDDDDVADLPPVIVGCEVAAQGGCHAEQPEVVVGDHRGLDPLRLTQTGQVDVDGIDRGQVLERAHPA